MATSSSTLQSLKNMKEGEAFCKCDDGWTCLITKTEPSKAGKPFYKCGGGCTCSIKSTSESISQVQDIQQVLETTPLSGGTKAFCACGEGWSCVISKTGGPEAGKTFFECGEGCSCLIDESNNVKVTCA